MMKWRKEGGRTGAREREKEQRKSGEGRGRGMVATLVRGLSVAKQCLSETAAISLIAHSNAK